MKQPKNLRNNDAKLERRYQGAQELRVKKAEAGPSTLSGYAAVFNSLSEDLGGFREQLAPGCFSADLSAGPDVRALINHDPNLVLGRTKSGTLRLSEDTTGLHFECDLPDTQAARDLATSISRGDVSACSFGFWTDADEWANAPDGSWLRTITACRLTDVSPVTYPAYTATSCSVRNLFPDGTPQRITRGMSQCNCQCTQCQDGFCEDCTNPDCDDPNCDECPQRSLRSACVNALLRVRIAQSL